MNIGYYTCAGSPSYVYYKNILYLLWQHVRFCYFFCLVGTTYELTVLQTVTYFFLSLENVLLLTLNKTEKANHILYILVFVHLLLH